MAKPKITEPVDENASPASTQENEPEGTLCFFPREGVTKIVPTNS